MKYGLGDRYKSGNKEYIVASAGINKVVLICLENGCRVEDPVDVENHHNISQNEWYLITGRCLENFKFISEGTRPSITLI